MSNIENKLSMYTGVPKENIKKLLDHKRTNVDTLKKLSNVANNNSTDIKNYISHLKNEYIKDLDTLSMVNIALKNQTK